MKAFALFLTCFLMIQPARAEYDVSIYDVMSDRSKVVVEICRVAEDRSSTCDEFVFTKERFYEIGPDKVVDEIMGTYGR